MDLEHHSLVYFDYAFKTSKYKEYLAFNNVL